MTVTKKTIIKLIQGQLELPSNQSAELVETVIEVIKKKLESGEDIMISEFGKFCVKEKKTRKGRNPATGKKIILDPRRVVTFQCSRKLREKINSK